jgi:molybdopterin-guanine dinucleotide biosynthesis protein A
LLSSHADWSIFLACDIPLISQQFIQLLVNRVRATHSDAVVPRTEDGWQPLSAAYHSRCRTAFAQAIEEGRRSIIRLLDEVRVEVITHDEMVSAGLSEEEITNMNTPEDWARIAELSKGAR